MMRTRLANFIVIVACAVVGAFVLVAAFPVAAVLVSTLPVAAAASVSASAPHAQIDAVPTIADLAVGPSAILSDREVQTVRDMFVGRALTSGSVDAIIAAFNELYAAKGFIAQALILPQTVEDGVIEVTFVEARVGQVRVEDNVSTKDEFFTRRLPLTEGDLVDVDRLDDDVTFMNRTNDVSARIELVPGDAFGETDLVVFVQEPVYRPFVLAVDGSGREESGRYRTTVSWQTPSLTRYRDVLALSVLSASGTNSATISYSYPVGRRGTRLDTAYSVNNVEFRDGQFGPVGLRVDTRSGSVTVSHPVIAKADVVIVSSVEWHFRESHTFLEGTRLTGSASQAGVMAMTIEMIEPWGSWTFNQAVRLGHARTPNVPATSYTKYTAGLQMTRVVQPVARPGVGPASVAAAPRWVVRAAGQRSDQPLLTSDEQFHLGGSGTVRGYNQGKVSGDGGYYVNVEYHWPWNQYINGYVFADHGGVFPHNVNDAALAGGKYLTGAGLGLHGQLSTAAQLHMHYGVPIGNEDESGQLQFRLQITF